MGVDIRWFNHDKHEYIDLGNRWGYTGHPSACVFYALMRDAWNGDRVQACSDHDWGNEFFDYVRAGYRNVTDAAIAEAERLGCWCIPGQTPDDPPTPPTAPPPPTEEEK